MLHNYAVINEKLNNLNIATKYFKFGQQVNPVSADNYYGEAICQFKMGNYLESKKAVKVAVKIAYSANAKQEQSNDDSHSDHSSDEVSKEDKICSKIFMQDRRVLRYFLAMVYKKL